MNEQDLRTQMERCGVPFHMRDGLALYLLHGYHPGSFLEAVLSNDLREACKRADDTNRHRLFEYVQFLHNYAPIVSWGSPEAVQEWCEAHAAARYGAGR